MSPPLPALSNCSTGRTPAALALARSASSWASVDGGLVIPILAASALL